MTVTQPGIAPAQKWCSKCETGKPIQEFAVNRGRRDGLSVYCVQCIRDYTRAQRLRLRKEALTTLGAICVSCGYDKDERALQFDHVESDGRTARQTPEGRGESFYRAIISGKLAGKIQVLCANCNQIKVWEASERDRGRVYERRIPTERIDRPNARWTIEQRQRQSDKAKAMWADPEKKETIRANQVRAGQDPALRAIRSRAASDNMRQRWASGEIPNQPGRQRDMKFSEPESGDQGPPVLGDDPVGRVGV